jgi:hypothetical protein
LGQFWILSPFKQGFCFSHPSNALMVGMAFKRIHHYLCASGIAKVFFKPSA